MSGTATGATSQGAGCATCVKGKHVRDPIDPAGAAPPVGGACVDCVAGKFGRDLVPTGAPVGFVAENLACEVLFFVNCEYTIRPYPANL